MKIILISGLSGSGKTVALDVLEDSGFYCVDNLPLPLLPELVHLHLADADISRLGISIDIRSKPDTAAMLAYLAQLRQDGHEVEILFLEADEAVLLRRFSETRRSHPLSREAMTLPESLQREKRWLCPLREVAYCIDTSQLNARQLRHLVAQWQQIDRRGLLLSIESFGFKHGAPPHTDFVFDVRCLPNPYYDPALRPFNGQDAPIQAFFAQEPQVAEMVADIEHFLRRWLPQMQRESRSYVTVGIGCTGGQHRSVFIAEQLGRRLQTDFRVLVRHRQLAEAA